MCTLAEQTVCTVQEAEQLVTRGVQKKNYEGRRMCRVVSDVSPIGASLPHNRPAIRAQPIYLPPGARRLPFREGLVFALSILVEVPYRKTRKDRIYRRRAILHRGHRRQDIRTRPGR